MFGTRLSYAFCYVCYQDIEQKQLSFKIIVSTKLCIAYVLYSGMPMGDQDKLCAPHVTCGCCLSSYSRRMAMSY